jgi:hypothetical protein
MHLARGQMESPKVHESKSLNDVKAHTARINTLLDGDTARLPNKAAMPPIARRPSSDDLPLTAPKEQVAQKVQIKAPQKA